MISRKQRTFGQFETPPNVADLLLGFCLRRSSDRVLDPSCGEGAFLQRAEIWRNWLAHDPSRIVPDGLWGVELDSETASAACQNLPLAHIVTQNFFTLEPDPDRLFDVIIGNPPYTRAEWIGRLHREAGQQLSLDLPRASSSRQEGSKQRLIPRDLWGQLDSRSGLYAYFFLHTARFLREGGRLGFVVPNSWLDAAYGEKLKQFILDHFRVVSLIESGVERWFTDAKINTCLVILERCSGPDRRDGNFTRLVRLKRPLGELIPYPLNHRQRPVALDQLVTRLLPSHNRSNNDYGVRLIPQRELSADSKWGLALRAPAAYRRRLEQADIPQLGSWSNVKRGFTTGANSFFYLDSARIEKWGIEPQFHRPVLKSLRGIDHLRLASESCRLQLLTVHPTADLYQTAVAEYVAWGEQQGYQHRHTCAHRHPWYSLPPQQPAAVVLPKGIWRRYLAPALDEPLLFDQQLYGVLLSPDVPALAAAALLNSAWFALQCELHGRVNFGEGVLWLAGYETGAMRLPDPRQLSPEQTSVLAELFTTLSARPRQTIIEELSRPDQRALDLAVFDLMGFTEAEQEAVLDTLHERVYTRLRRAGVEG